MQRKIIKTKDNSKTLLIPEMEETYHSTNGALTEANHIFINQGISLHKDVNETVNIFEMGLGTGLNAILTYRFSKQHNINTNYFSIEKYPVSTEELNILDYASLLNFNKEEHDVFNEIHSCNQNIEKELSNNFNFSKTYSDLKDLNLKDNSINTIYFDAFAPRHQPDLWDEKILKKMFNSLKPNGFLITYCAQGKFKRTLKSLGFSVKALPGPPGKREITKAIKSL